MWYNESIEIEGVEKEMIILSERACNALNRVYKRPNHRPLGKSNTHRVAMPKSANGGLIVYTDKFTSNNPRGLADVITEDVKYFDSYNPKKPMRLHHMCFNQVNKKRGLKIMKMDARDETKDIIYDKYIKMKPEVREYWLVYNSPNYFDSYLGKKTYLDDVGSWLTLFREKATKYGTCFKEKRGSKVNDAERYQGPVVGNFHFFNSSGYRAVRQAALTLQRDEAFIKATKEMVNIFVEDADSARARILNQIFAIVESEETSASTKLDGLFKAAKMLGVDAKETTNKLDITLRGLESAYSIEGFNFGPKDKEEEEDTETQGE